MALDLGTLAATLAVNDAPLKKTLRDVPQEAKAAGKKIGDGVAEGAKPGLSNFTKLAGAAVAALSARAIGDWVKGRVDDFSELEDATAAASVVFGKNMDAIIAQSKTADRQMGMSEKQVIDAANTFGTYGKGAGLAGSALSDFSTQMTQTAGDMSSFKGGTPEEAIEAVGAALRGEMEPIRRYGVLLDDASLRNAALKLGLIETTKQALTPQQKVLAAQAEILRQTADAQGDFARTSDSTANVGKTQAAVMANLSAELGQKLAPTMTNAKKVGIEFLTWVLDNQTALIPMVTTVGALALVMGTFVAAAKGVEALKSAKATIDGLKVSLDGMSTAARVATVSAGAIGIAAAAFSIAYGIWAQASAEAKQQVDDLTAAIKADSGALGENARAYAANAMQKSGALDAAQKLGVGVDVAVSAALGEKDAIDQINAAYAARTKAINEAADAEGGSRDAFLDSRAELTKLGDSYNLLSGNVAGLQSSTQEALANQQQFEAAVGSTSTTSSKAAAAAADLADGVTGANGAATTGKTAFDRYADSINKAYKATLGLRGDKRALEAAIDDVSESVKKNGKTLDTNTEKGRANQAALDGVASAALSVVEGMKATNTPADKVAAQMDKSRASFIKAAESMGMSKKAAQELATKLGLIKGKEITVTASVSLNRSADEIVYKVGKSGSMKFTARAGGGRLIPGLGYLVGELGPELLQVDQPSMMTNHRDTKRILEASRGNQAQDRAPLQVNITTHNPVAEPASETTNKALQYAAALGVDA